MTIHAKIISKLLTLDVLLEKIRFKIQSGITGKRLEINKKFFHCVMEPLNIVSFQ